MSLVTPRRTARAAAPFVAAAAGLLLVGAVVSWKLATSTYAGDVEVICGAEDASGLVLDREMARVTRWVQGRLTTRAGGEFFASLRDEPLRERGGDLRARALALALGSCPLARSYDELWARSEYQGDVQLLCSRFTFPDLSDLAPATRVQRIAEWLEMEPTTAQARALAPALRHARTARKGAEFLREVASNADVLTCDVAGTLETELSLTCP